MSRSLWLPTNERMVGDDAVRLDEKKRRGFSSCLGQLLSELRHHAGHNPEPTQEAIPKKPHVGVLVNRSARQLFLSSTFSLPINYYIQLTVYYCLLSSQQDWTDWKYSDLDPSSTYIVVLLKCFIYSITKWNSNSSLLVKGYPTKATSELDTERWVSLEYSKENSVCFVKAGTAKWWTYTGGQKVWESRRADHMGRNSESVGKGECDESCNDINQSLWNITFIGWPLGQWKILRKGILVCFP